MEGDFSKDLGSSAALAAASRSGRVIGPAVERRLAGAVKNEIEINKINSIL